MCTGEAYNKMEDAYFEVVDALVTAIGRTEELRDWLKLFPTGAPSDDEVKSALLTFEVIFGKVYGSHGQIQAGLDTIQQVIAKAAFAWSVPWKHILRSNPKGALPDDANAILSTIYMEDEAAPPTFDWYCSNEAWLKPLGGKRYLDMFSPRGLGQNEIELYHIYDDNPRGLVAFMTHYEDLIDTLYATDRLTFCPARLETLDWSLEEARQRAVNGDRVHLDQLEEHTVGLNFLHELGHLQVAMGIDGAYADVPWAGGPNGKPYGWAAIRAITPALAERNADNFMCWVIAMFLDDCDWHTGWVGAAV